MDISSLGLVAEREVYATESPPYAGSIALRLISAAYVNTNAHEYTFLANRFTVPGFHTDGFDRTNATVIPILSSPLLPTHPLQSRNLALNVLHASLLQLILPEMAGVTGFLEHVAAEDFKNLLQVVGDPFLFTRDISPLDRRAEPFRPDYEPTDAAVLLIEFASSELWQNHLDSSNFTTCEKFLSTEESKRTVIEHVLKTPVPPRLKPLCRATKVVVAIRRLEELQCLVIMWAWAVGPLLCRRS